MTPKELPLVEDPDPRLRVVCKPIKRFGVFYKGLALDMFATMYAHNGIGLAAPQVGVGRRMIVMDVGRGLDREPTPKVLLNPRILQRGSPMVSLEGCLSVPNRQGHVPRHASVRVRYDDLDGMPHEETFDVLHAFCVAHEIDHLDGVLFTDKLASYDQDNPATHTADVVPFDPTQRL